MFHQSAPIAAHDITQALVAVAGGVKPIPLVPGSSAMRAVPVYVVLHDNGESHRLSPSSFTLAEHVAANEDPESKLPIGPEQPAALVFHVRLPPGFSFRGPKSTAQESTAQESTGQESAAVTWTIDRLPGTPIPELEGLDPEIFAAHPEKVNEGLRGVFLKGKPQGDSQ